MFERALEIDPQFIDAMAGLALNWFHAVAGEWSNSGKPAKHAVHSRAGEAAVIADLALREVQIECRSCNQSASPEPIVEVDQHRGNVCLPAAMPAAVAPRRSIR